ncbi:MAG: polysaccharide export protein [Pedobacter sp.]|nr:MAG: polysaccharide export protein [Pedobacter sp.]
MATRSLLFISLITLIAVSCTPTKNVAYLSNIQDASFKSNMAVTEAPIQSNDILSIYISSLDAEASAIFNANNTFIAKSTTATGTSTQSAGYLVNMEGNIQMPILGNVKAAGLTKTELKQSITQALLTKKLLIDPVVDIRYLNFEVTVLGEVAKPTVITVPSERISLVKALGLAGDLTIYGKRTNVLLIREENGKRTTRRIDLNSPNFISSPYYYLQPNDVVYVEPNKAKIASAGRSQQLLPIILSSLSVVVIVLDRVIK